MILRISLISYLPRIWRININSNELASILNQCLIDVECRSVRLNDGLISQQLLRSPRSGRKHYRKYKIELSLWDVLVRTFDFGAIALRLSQSVQDSDN